MIYQVSYTSARSSFGPENIKKFKKMMATAYQEYGISERVTTFVIPQYIQVWEQSRNSYSSGMAYAVDSGVRLGILSGSNLLSVQASYKYGQAVGLAVSEGIISSQQAEARLLYGRNLYFLGHKIYMDTEGFWRWTAPPRPNEAGLDTTVGIFIDSYTDVILQNFSVLSAGYGAKNYLYYAQHKAGVSVVETLPFGWKVQLGGLFAYAGHNVVAERGVTLALWISL